MSALASRIVAVLPALDCEKTVGRLVRALQPQVERVIVVNDGSRDATAAAARAGFHRRWTT